VAVAVDVAVFVFVAVAVLVSVAVGVGVSVGVSVAVGVGVSVGVSVAVGVGVSVGVSVAVGVGVSVGVSVAVGVGVSVGVSDGVAVSVAVGVSVFVAVAVGGELATIAQTNGDIVRTDVGHGYVLPGIAVEISNRDPPGLCVHRNFRSNRQSKSHCDRAKPGETSGFRRWQAGMPALQSENYVKSRKPRHIGKIGVSIWLAICYGEADINQLRIEK